ncbi:MAG: HAD-IA family hydrolase [Burkholderiaceae bacterium]
MKPQLNLHPLLLENDVRGLVFDLDGTLIDSAPDIIHGLRVTFEEGGLGRLPEDYFPDNLHGTSDGIIRSILADMGWPIPADLAPIKARYVEHYAALGHQRTQAYTGVHDVLSACRDAALPLGICTNKVHSNAIAAAQKVGIHDLFDFISGADTWPASKPSPVPLLETIRMLGLTPEQCLYFGDTSVDAECAHAAGVRFVLYESGYGDAEVAGVSRHFTFSDWGELLAPDASLAIQDEA